MKAIPYGKQNITDADINSVIETLKGDYLTQGPKIKEFEDKFAKYVNAEYAVAVSNGTAALHLAAMALDVKQGQKVITTPITFAASANCIQYCGGEIVFGEIDPETYLLDLKSVRDLLEASPRGTYAGIIPVDFAGHAIDLEAFRELANEYDLWIIEDACHSPGGFFIDSHNEKQLCGNGKYADLAVFSFHPVKHIASGEGGMITTNNIELYEKLLRLRTHGIVKSQELFTNSVSLAGGEGDLYPGWYMEMQELGFNYRLTDFQAALGLSQLERANEGLQKRIEIAKLYSEKLGELENVLGMTGNVEGHAYHLFILEVQDRLRLYNFLREKNIFAQIHYIPCHLMPYYNEKGWKEGDRIISETYYKHCISLPMYPTLTIEEQEYVIKCIKEYYNE